jgi:hypothetical protein
VKITDTFKGYPLIAWCNTEVQSDNKKCGFFLVQTRETTGPSYGQQAEWCVAFYRDGDHEWTTGYYTQSLKDAYENFIKRTIGMMRRPNED